MKRTTWHLGERTRNTGEGSSCLGTEKKNVRISWQVVWNKQLTVILLHEVSCPWPKYSCRSKSEVVLMTRRQGQLEAFQTKETLRGKKTLRFSGEYQIHRLRQQLVLCTYIHTNVPRVYVRVHSTLKAYHLKATTENCHIGSNTRDPHHRPAKQLSHSTVKHR